MTTKYFALELYIKFSPDIFRVQTIAETLLGKGFRDYEDFESSPAALLTLNSQDDELNANLPPLKTFTQWKTEKLAQKH